ncbi:class I adenylate-forming enzyme family protein [Rhodococcus sp. NPDC059968]|uniref:class I adenylate-forming enzyme family protein n=1 Tax=Rhodococcus sp. NPDC059968 TaxID=3347017 RepID=UPI00367186D5
MTTTTPTMDALLDDAARQWPGKMALNFPALDRSLTFGELRTWVDHTTAFLFEHGIAQGKKVAILLQNRPESTILWLAAAKLGAAVVPVNSRYAADEVEYVLEHSEADILITEPTFRPILTDVSTEVTVVDYCELSNTSASFPPIGANVSGDTVLNVQYTSGTTSRPKGCLLTHDYWLRIAEEMTRPDEDGSTEVAIRHEDHMLIAQPMYYMDPFWHIATILRAGATLTILDGFHPSTFWADIRRHHITIFYCLGAMPTLLLKMPETGDDKNHSVRAILCSAIPPRRHQELEDRWGAPWYELYGMTETGVDIRVRARDHDAAMATTCIGKAGVGREATILDSNGVTMTKGEVGELALRGRSLMLGYFRDPENTSATIDANGWLHTGDLAWMDTDGNVHYEGRKKQMIRRAGENISAAQVEEVLMLHPAVGNAACVPVADDLRGEEVFAFVQPANAAVLPASDLAAFARQHLAVFKVPRFWMFVDQMPTTPSERVAKTALVDQTLAQDRVFDSAAHRWVPNPFQLQHEAPDVTVN